MKFKKTLSGVLALILTVSLVSAGVYAEDVQMDDSFSLEQYIGNDADSSDYYGALDLSDNDKIVNYIKVLYKLNMNEKNKVYAFNQCYSGNDEKKQPPYFFISLDEKSGKKFECSSLFYPFECASEISSIIKEYGLSLYVYPEFYQKHKIKLSFDKRYVTQKQLLELTAEIFDRTGQNGNYNPGEFDFFEPGDEYISEEFSKENKYDMESGIHIREVDDSPIYDGAAEITEQGIIDMYREIAEHSGVSDFLDYCPECNGKSVKLFSFDKVRFDNSKINGICLNRSLLMDQVYYSACMNRKLCINLNESADLNEITDYLRTTYSLSEKNIRISSGPYNSIILIGFHQFTTELAEQICDDLKNSGFISADFDLAANDQRVQSEIAGFSYPEKVTETISRIISEMGLNVGIRKRTDIENYIELNFTDVENMTQMDAVNLRYEIYKATGLRGIDDDADNIPSYNGILQFSLTNSTAVPDKVTYIDIKLGQNTGFFAFVTQLDYDHDNLELVSASLKKDLAEDTDFTVANDLMLLSNKKSSNINMSNEDVIRLGFKVKSDAADGKYEIKLSAPEDEKTGVCCINNSSPEWVKSEFSSGYITVSKNAVPKTEVNIMTLKRLYATINNSSSRITGDVNNDGILNVMDIIRTKKYLIGTEKTISNADVNEDGNVNIADVLVLSEHLLNID